MEKKLENDKELNNIHIEKINCEENMKLFGEKIKLKDFLQYYLNTMEK